MRKKPTDLMIKLPKVLPIIAQNGKILLQGSKLYIDISQPQDLKLVSDVMAKRDRLIGIVQPLKERFQIIETSAARDLYKIGTAGRIINFEELESGEVTITLAGICRFRIIREIETKKGYRCVEPMWEEFVEDIGSIASDTMHTNSLEPNKEMLLNTMQKYFDVNGIAIDWTNISSHPLPSLVDALSMICPFDPAEKQALLEATSQNKRFDLLISLAEIHSLGHGASNHRH